MLCKECNSEIELCYDKETKTQLIKYQLCFNCNFWREKVDIKDREEVARIDGAHYIIGKNDHSPNRFRGFGGSKFTISFFDGREIVTSDLWYQGVIPDKFKKRLPDNAKFIRNKQ